MELPQLLDFYVTEKPVQPSFSLYSDHVVGNLRNKGLCFGAILSSLASRSVKKRFDYIVKLDDPSYKVVRVKNGGFTMSLIDCESTITYPTDERGYNSARMLVSVSSPELLEKTGGKPVCLFVYACELMKLIATGGGTVGLTIPGEFYLKPFRCNYFITTTGFYRIGNSNKADIEGSIRLSAYRGGRTTTKLTPGKLYLYKGNTSAVIYLGKIGKVVCSYFTRMSSIPGLCNVAEELSRLPRINMEENVDLFISVDYDSCAALIDNPTKPTLLEFIEDLVRKGQVESSFYCGGVEPRKTKLRLVETETVIDLPSDLNLTSFFRSIAGDAYDRTGAGVFMALCPELLKKKGPAEFLSYLETDVRKAVKLNYVNYDKGKTTALDLLKSYYFSDRTTIFTHPDLLGMSELELHKEVSKMLEKIK